MATMKDVAEKAGVSLSTVSYVLSGSRPISETTKARILKVMDELDFHPNAVARALAAKRTRVIALLLSPQERGLGIPEMEFVRGASEAARAVDHHLVLLTEGMDSETDLAYLKRQGLVDGVILMEVRLLDSRIPLLQKLGLPFSLIGRPEPAMDLAYVDLDFEATIKAVVVHLAGLGHRRLGFINQSRETFESGYGPSVRAYGAFERFAKQSGCAPAMAFSAPTPRDGWAACQHLLDQKAPPTALVVMNDRALPGVLQALAARGLNVPDDISVVSAVTSSASAEMMVPALTSSDVPSEELARLAVEQLVAAIEGFPHTDQVLIPCQLVPRASTGPCKSP